jgi:hypothetical protein
VLPTDEREPLAEFEPGFFEVADRFRVELAFEEWLGERGEVEDAGNPVHQDNVVCPWHRPGEQVRQKCRRLWHFWSVNQLCQLIRSSSSVNPFVRSSVGGWMAAVGG